MNFIQLHFGVLFLALVFGAPPVKPQPGQPGQPVQSQPVNTPVRAALRSAWTAFANVFVLGVPAAPSNLGAADAEDGVHALLTWQDNSNNETSFEFERQALGPDGVTWGASVLFSVPANTTSTSDACGPGTFRYRVRAVIE